MTESYLDFMLLLTLKNVTKQVPKSNIVPLLTKN